MFLRRLSQELIRHMHQSIFNCCSNLARVWPRNFCDWIRLSHGEKGLDFSQVIPCLTSNDAPMVRSEILDSQRYECVTSGMALT